MDDQIIEQPARPAAPPESPSSAQPRPGQDLSAQIEQAVVRERRDRVKCVRVFDDFYRCNWWAAVHDDAARGSAPWGVHAMSRVRKSQFLNATLHGDKLKIEVVNVPTSPGEN